MTGARNHRWRRIRRSQCALCHGDKLCGALARFLPLSGRTPSYIARQLYDNEHGIRKGPWTPLMHKAEEKQTDDDNLNNTSYETSLQAAPPLSLAKKMK